MQGFERMFAMNVKELKKELKVAGIPSEHYNLDGKILS